MNISLLNCNLIHYKYHNNWFILIFKVVFNTNYLSLFWISVKLQCGADFATKWLVMRQQNISSLRVGGVGDDGRIGWSKLVSLN